MNILHATNFTTAAEKAGTLASSLAGLLKGSLTVCHVLESQKGLPVGYMASPIAGYAMPTSQEFKFHRQMQAREGQQRAAYRQQTLTRLHALTPEGARSEMLDGDPVEALLKAAAAHDLLVMGWGDTSRRLLQQIRTPVLCTPEDCTVTKITRVLVGTDFSRAAAEALQWLLPLRRHGIDVVLAHVAQSGVVDRVERRLTELAEGAEVAAVLHTGTARDALPQLAEELQADVIAIGSKGRHPLVEALLQGTGRSLLEDGRHAVLSIASR